MTAREKLIALENVYDHEDSSEIFLEAMRDCLSHHIENNEFFRKYMNENVHMVLWAEHWDVVMIHQPRLQRLLSEIREVKEAKSSHGYSSERKKGHNSMDSDDIEYWNSVAREKALKDAGLHDAAKIERKARLNYLKGGGYTSTYGGSQVHYQGSKEQKEHLEAFHFCYSFVNECMTAYRQYQETQEVFR